MSDKRVPSVRLIWLESFVAVAKSRSYKTAGVELELHPTVIAKNIRNLEQWLDSPLVLNFDRKVHVTQFGEEFLPKAQVIIESLYTSRQFMISKDNSKMATKHISSFFAKHMWDEKVDKF